MKTDHREQPCQSHQGISRGCKTMKISPSPQKGHFIRALKGEGPSTGQSESEKEAGNFGRTGQGQGENGGGQGSEEWSEGRAGWDGFMIVFLTYRIYSSRNSPPFSSTATPLFKFRNGARTNLFLQMPADDIKANYADQDQGHYVGALKREGQSGRFSKGDTEGVDCGMETEGEGGGGGGGEGTGREGERASS